MPTRSTDNTRITRRPRRSPDDSAGGPNPNLPIRYALDSVTVVDAPQFGPYQLLRWLGGGAMADVFRAEHHLLGLRVAVKVLHPRLAAQEGFSDLLMAEGRTLAGLRHPNIVNVFDIGHCDSARTLWLAMEYLHGYDLESLCARHQPTLLAALRITGHLAGAVAAAHAAGVVHRDIKPSNIFLARNDGHTIVKLVDFGIARTPYTPADQELKLTAGVLGSPPYLAPEQALSHQVDERCDIYALGGVLFRLLTQRPPFDGDSLGALVTETVCGPVPVPSEHTSLPGNVGPQLDDLVTWCMAKEPERRPQSALEVVRALRGIEQRLTRQQRSVPPEARRTMPPPVTEQPMVIIAPAEPKVSRSQLKSG